VKEPKMYGIDASLPHEPVLPKAWLTKIWTKDLADEARQAALAPTILAHDQGNSLPWLAHSDSVLHIDGRSRIRVTGSCGAELS